MEGEQAWWMFISIGTVDWESWEKSGMEKDIWKSSMYRWYLNPLLRLADIVQGVRINSVEV